jgi:NADP-dependent 3-hydroxy acid dehydrogenase YdfG
MILRFVRGFNLCPHETAQEQQMQTANLPGRTAVVTGASRGFGRAIAVGLAATGVRVVGVARDNAALEDVRHQLGSSFTPVAADVTEEGLAARLIPLTAEQVADAVIHVAGHGNDPVPAYLLTADGLTALE